jgi:hypothetical protein
MNIIQTFHNISKPFVDTKGGPKLEAILNELESSDFKKEFIPEVGLIVNQQDNPRLIIVSHMDLIPLFNRFFETGQVEKELPLEDSSIFITGALDNTLTNAVLIELIKNIKSSDIEFVFSEGEERGMTGMRNYMNLFPEKTNSFFINLDVTNDNWGSDISVEYDRPDKEIEEQTREILQELSFEIQNFRFCDDMDAILFGGGKGYSYCIPTKNIIHSLDSTVKKSSIEPYYEGLKRLAEGLNP